MSPQAPLAEAVSLTFLVFRTLTVSRRTGQVLCEMPLFSDIFLMLRLQLCVFREEDDRGKVPFHHIIARVPAISLTYQCWYQH